MPVLQLKQMLSGGGPDALGDAFGVEFEAEHCGEFVDAKGYQNLRLLEMHEDGSLRDRGREFTSPPWTLKEFPNSLKEFIGLRDRYNFTFGHRTSTHIHVNVGDLSPEQVAAVYGLLVALEPTFMRMVTTTRRNNLFCQPITHCPNSVFDIPVLAAAKNKAQVRMFQTIKYCAISTARLFDLHTIEFRAMEGCAKGKEDLLLCIMEALRLVKQAARTLSCAELCDVLLLDYENVERLVFNQHMQDIAARQHDLGDIPTPEKRCLALARAALLSVKNRGMYEDVQHLAGTVTRIAGNQGPLLAAPDLPNVILKSLRGLPVGASLFGFQKIADNKYVHQYVDNGAVFSVQYVTPEVVPRDFVTFNIGEV